MKLSTSLAKAVVAGALILISSAIQSRAATFTVTNTKDHGPGSLRQAVAAASANGEADTINFDASLFGAARTITLSSEIRFLPDGTNPGMLVTINGPGANLLTISGGNAVRPFSLAPNSSVRMSGITLRDGNGVGSVINGEGRSGGAILVHEASLTLTNMVIRNNTVPNTGGGIYIDSSKPLTISDSLFIENKANDCGAISSRGSSVKSVTNTIISNNRATNDTGGAFFRDGTITIADVRVTGNKSALPGASGGGGSVGGFGFYQINGSVTDTVIADNTSGDAAANMIGSCGGLSADGGLMTFERLSVTGNSIFDSAGGSGIGGGMCLRAPSQKMTVIDSLIAGNSGGDAGGGIYISSGFVDIINTTVAKNATDGDGIGGGIVNGADLLNIINSTIADNVSHFVRSADHYGSGGIIGNFHGGQLQIRNSIVANNSGPGDAPDVQGTVTSNGYNIIGNTTGSSGFGATGDQLNIDPLLDPNGLQNNGGTTLTVALQPNSPAIDKGKTVDGATTDQRGVTRPTDNPAIPNADGGDGSDVGAYEIGASNGVAEKTLGNISTRLPVLTGDNVPIGGIIVVGKVAKRVIIRALGPSLGAAGVAGTLENPTLQLFQGETLLASNDDWKNDQQAAIAATGVAPGDEREAAIVRMLNPGSYTAIVRGKDGTTGVALVEAYDLNQRPNSKLANISTRGFIGTGDNVLVGGFIVGPTTRIVVRAIGPSLASSGIKGALQDPTLQLVDADGDVIAANDDWKGIQQQEIEATGVPPSNGRESALVETLTAGNYTAVVRGSSGTTGIGLVEVYNLP